MGTKGSMLQNLALTTIVCCAESVDFLVPSTLGGVKQQQKYETRAARPEIFSETAVNVHIVPHTHDDVGWLKTVDQYYYGANNTIQHAGVRYILDSVITQLQQDPARRFTYVEMAFFSRWFYDQTPSMQDTVRGLVASGQLDFVNGGWCMHDEATTHYAAMIDQTTLGHWFLAKEFDGFAPRVGWQIDPFGHSATQASLLSWGAGFDALFFGRIDYQDRERRQKAQECEGVWRASESLGADAQVFWGLTGSYGGNYGPPEGLYFDSFRDDAVPVMDDAQLADFNVDERVATLVQAALDQAAMTKGNHVMMTMGLDFHYESASQWLGNLDKLMHYANALAGDQVNVFYSTPTAYADAKHAEGTKWTVKTDDFFPYADSAHAYWTGYFTSRPLLKRFERVSSGLLQAFRQLEVLTAAGPAAPPPPPPPRQRHPPAAPRRCRPGRRDLQARAAAVAKAGATAKAGTAPCWRRRWQPSSRRRRPKRRRFPFGPRPCARSRPSRGSPSSLKPSCASSSRTAPAWSPASRPSNRPRPPSALWWRRSSSKARAPQMGQKISPSSSSRPLRAKRCLRRAPSASSASSPPPSSTSLYSPALTNRPPARARRSRVNCRGSSTGRRLRSWRPRLGGSPKSARSPQQAPPTRPLPAWPPPKLKPMRTAAPPPSPPPGGSKSFSKTPSTHLTLPPCPAFCPRALTLRSSRALYRTTRPRVSFRTGTTGCTSAVFTRPLARSASSATRKWPIVDDMPSSSVAYLSFSRATRIPSRQSISPRMKSTSEPAGSEAMTRSKFRFG
mmetsp:Transcript_3428/g.7967  ORF Transcript_3428/g.7967 Transcript_3428/m.7967 type:complete len:788 (+) Transcript_3428:97-2460(+)